MAVPNCFTALPLKERLFVRARLFSTPLEAIARRAPVGRIADVGCGHGLLTALLAEGHPERQVVGVDPDPAKIAHAQQGPGTLLNVTLQVGTIDSLSPGFDAVVVADVLYLLPPEQWSAFLKTAHQLLNPGGTLLLKEAEANHSWKYWKCVAQERVMVNVLRKTHSSGGLGFKPRAETESLLRAAGFASVEAIDVSTGYATPHVLFVATRTQG